MTSSDYFTGALVLVSCVGQKRNELAPARDLYRSAWFTKARAYVEKRHADWRIISALYGLVVPDAVIEPYERTLNKLGVVERREWAERVYGEIRAQLVGHSRVVFLAGQRYREYLAPKLIADGYRVEVPMEGLTIGRQIAWLSR